MKRALLSGLMLALMASVALASNEYLVKKKALDIRDNNNAAQGITPAAPAANSAAPAPAAAAGISTAQQQAIDKVQADLAEIKAGTTVSADQKKKLLTDISNLSKGSIKPSKTVLGKLADDLGTVLSDKAVTAKDKDQALLAKDINIVVNSENLTTAQTLSCVPALQAALKNCGVGEQQQATITADLKAISKNLQDSKPNLYK